MGNRSSKRTRASLTPKAFLAQKEEDLQKDVAQLLDTLGLWWWHTPNGGTRVFKVDAKGRRYSPEGKRLKVQGVKSGVADVIIGEEWECPVLCAGAMGPSCEWCHGMGFTDKIAIELKSATGRVTPEQREWLQAARDRGWLVAVCRSVDEVLSVLQGLILPGRRAMPSPTRKDAAPHYFHPSEEDEP